MEKNISNFDFLKNICEASLAKKNIDKASCSKYLDRLKYELQVLKDLGFIDYILLNWDIINFCHENKIPTGPGRGSAAGSLVLFLIGVTKVDPIKYDLFFERFVSKSRARKIQKDGVVYPDGSLLADIDNDIVDIVVASIPDIILRDKDNSSFKARIDGSGNQYVVTPAPETPAGKTRIEDIHGDPLSGTSYFYTIIPNI